MTVIQHPASMQRSHGPRLASKEDSKEERGIVVYSAPSQEGDSSLMEEPLSATPRRTGSTKNKEIWKFLNDKKVYQEDLEVDLADIILEYLIEQDLKILAETKFQEGVQKEAKAEIIGVSESTGEPEMALINGVLFTSVAYQKLSK